LPIHTISPFLLNPPPFKAWMEGYGGNVCGRIFRQSMSEGNCERRRRQSNDEMRTTQLWIADARQLLKRNGLRPFTRGWLWLKNPKQVIRQRPRTTRQRGE